METDFHREHQETQKGELDSGFQTQEEKSFLSLGPSVALGGSYILFFDPRKIFTTEGHRASQRGELDSGGRKIQSFPIRVHWRSFAVIGQKKSDRTANERQSTQMETDFHRERKETQRGELDLGLPKPSFLSLCPSVALCGLYFLFFDPRKVCRRERRDTERGIGFGGAGTQTKVLIVSVIRVHWRPFAVVFQTQKIPGRFPGRGSLSL